MRTLLLAAVSAVAIASPAMAQTTGNVGLSYSDTSYDGNFDYDSWVADGSLAYALGNGWVLQGDLAHEMHDYSGGDEDTTRLAVHGMYRTDNWTAGLAAGTGNEVFGGDFGFIGLEGAYHLQNWSFTGTALFGNSDDFNYDYDRYRVAAKYFFTDNFSVGGGVAMSDFEGTDWESFDLGAEYRFGSHPIVLTGGYTLSDVFTDEPRTWTFGARWEFGTENLRESNRTGPQFQSDIAAIYADNRRFD